MKPTHELDEYLLRHSEPESALLKELTRETWTTRMNPRMLSGHLQGRFLSFLSKLIKPSAILEIGTYTGYSAICLSEGLQPDGILYTIDTDDEVQELAGTYFKRAGISEKVRILTGDARQLIPGLSLTFDLVFIDGEKREYREYYEAALPLVKNGGIIVADNVLWDHKVLLPAEKGDHATHGIQEFNAWVHQDARVSQFILPFRDGLNLIMKK